MGRIVLDKRGEGVAELLIALLIVSVFAAFAVPRLWGFGTALRLDGEAAQLASELMRYRETVITRQPIHRNFWFAKKRLPQEESSLSCGSRLRISGAAAFFD